MAKLSQEEKERIMQLHKQELHPSVIAQRVGCSKETVRNVIRNNGESKHFYFFQAPDGTIHRTSNVTDFSINQNLESRYLYSLNSGSIITYKGWSKATEEEWIRQNSQNSPAEVTHLDE
ncbi:helix-turn-helix domain-containing protein (plasmid) [Kovacikia minuta CCNUW1]|uniref:helix-turn-helix domain-containing protein n=1 Tax=Kovacikia minuta TaxID=2931930 RepID=UPI001CCF6388|nr:helix-turn-helix domain-containing protein [Kovacikia minuta]UBF29924.1 helix-turn-helix domain-containing protein [Kovacikia minuta CCNUW1]